MNIKVRRMFKSMIDKNVEKRIFKNIDKSELDISKGDFILKKEKFLRK